MASYRVGLDIRMLHHSGIGTYLRGLLAGMKGLGMEKEPALFGPEPANGHPGGTFPAPIYSIGEQLQYPSRLRQCSLWHAPHYNVPVFKGNTKLVVTIHDIIHWIFRKEFLTPLQRVYAGFMLKKAVASADRIIAVSHHTKKDLIEQFQARDEKITVIHEGVNESFREMPPDELRSAFEKIRAKHKLPEDFFLYVGMIKPHKNVLRLARLFCELKKQVKISASLVLIGRKDRAYPAGYEELATLTTSGGVFYLPAIDPEELKIFYNQAIALVHPSLYEGFGLTLLEAMAFGTPVLTTNSSSIPEVVGDAALRVDATDESAMGAALVRLDQDKTLRESLRLKGLERVKMFRWTETARKTAEVYDKVLAEK